MPVHYDMNRSGENFMNISTSLFVNLATEDSDSEQYDFQDHISCVVDYARSKGLEAIQWEGK